MSMFFKKQTNIEQMFEYYLDCVGQCMEMFKAGMCCFLEHGQGETFDHAVASAHQRESKADDLRREIERTLYIHHLLPDSRGDLLGLLESVDKIPNRIELVLFNIKCRQIVLPEGFGDDLGQLVDTVCKSVEVLIDSIALLFKQPGKVRDLVRQVDELESQSDQKEQALKENIYKLGDLDLAEKMLLERMIIEVASIADRAEETSDRLEIISIKRTL